MPGHSHRIALAYDLDLARRLLAEAGYPDGKGLPELELLVPEWLRDPAPLLEQWAALGACFRVVRGRIHALKSVPPSTHLWLNDFVVDYPDPDGFFRGFFAGKPSFHTDDEIEEMIERARGLQDQGERMRLYHDLDRLVVAERAAILPIFYGRFLVARRPWVESVSLNPMEGAYLDEAVVRRG